MTELVLETKIGLPVGVKQEIELLGQMHLQVGNIAQT